MKFKKTKTQTWPLPVSKSGVIKLPLALREAAFLWEGDAVQAAVAEDENGFYLTLRVLHHGLTREEIHRFEKRILRGIARDEKAGKFIALPKFLTRLDGKLIAEARASGPAKPLRKSDFARVLASGISRGKARKSRP